jgi:hypothetical protein
MKSYITRQTKTVRERVEAKLELSLVRRLEKYCEYLASDRDYVIGQALEIAIQKDKGFREWLAAQAPDSMPGRSREEAAAQARSGRGG